MKVFNLTTRVPVLLGDRIRIALVAGKVKVSILHRENSMVYGKFVETILLNNRVFEFNQIEFEDRPSEYNPKELIEGVQANYTPTYELRPLSNISGPLGRQDMIGTPSYDFGYTSYLFSEILSPKLAEVLLVEQLRQMVFNFVTFSIVKQPKFILENYIDSNGCEIDYYLQKPYGYRVLEGGKVSRCLV